jgi:hypothetical protein
MYEDPETILKKVMDFMGLDPKKIKKKKVAVGWVLILLMLKQSSFSCQLTAPTVNNLLLLSVSAKKCKSSPFCI